MHWVYYFGRVLIYILMFPFSSWKKRGRENVPGPGPYLIISNHLHIGDPPLVGASFQYKSVFMAKSDLWENPWSRFWVKNYGAFPVKRGGVDREAIRQAEEWIKKGVSVVMFPEGTRSPDGKMHEALPGAVLIATRLNIPIIPVAITGSDKLRNARWAFFHRPRVTITIGKPFTLPPVEGKLTKEKRRELLSIMMGHIAAMLPPEYRGVYGEDYHAGN
jgi:1-acyl-sn-glycerol-3-phosphate acyltransferase